MRVFLLEMKSVKRKTQNNNLKFKIIFDSRASRQRSRKHKPACFLFFIFVVFSFTLYALRLKNGICRHMQKVCNSTERNSRLDIRRETGTTAAVQRTSFYGPRNGVHSSFLV
jgi:hypothetical protein